MYGVKTRLHNPLNAESYFIGSELYENEVFDDEPEEIFSLGEIQEDKYEITRCGHLLRKKNRLRKQKIKIN